MGIGGTGDQATPSYSFASDLSTGIFHPTTNVIGFSTGSIERARLDGNGNFGLGTSSPWAQLSVNPDGISGPAFVVGSSTGTNLIVTNKGNVGIGTSSPFATFLGTSA